MLIFSQKLKLLMLLLVMVLFFKIPNYFVQNLSSNLAGVGIFTVGVDSFAGYLQDFFS